MTEGAVMISQAMEDAVNAAAFSYRDLINEAFIVPIRSAVVVDDEFPTLDEFLSDNEAALKKPHAERAKDIIGFCRSRTPYPWIVDVHDGRNITIDGEVRSATHFDHTDLLVLDYHLNGDNEGGERAISLLRKLSSNEHFNLVIVYTNNDIANTVREIGLALSCFSMYEKSFPVFDNKFLSGVVLDWEAVEPSIVKELVNSIDGLSLIKAFALGGENLKGFEINEDFSLFCSILNRCEAKFNRLDMLKYVLGEKVKLLKKEMSESDYGLVEAGENTVDDGTVVNWIRVDSLFITVIKKSVVAPSEFANCLITAIEAWDPSPHRLILSRMRGEISKRGIIVEKEVLKNPYLQAAWLKDIFDRQPFELRTSVRRNIARHWESLGGKVEPGVLKFAEQLGRYLTDNSVESSRYSDPIVLSSVGKIALHVNNFVCSKPVEGYHLFTGHVFVVGEEYWICLTPACDLEPRGDCSISGHLGNWKAFKAAQLIPMPKSDKALENATRGNHLFLSIEGEEPVAFTFSTDPGSEQSITPTLRWQQFYAKNQGRFLEHSNVFGVARSADNQGSLEFSEHEAKVVAHVRYEYALHLLHRLGSHLSRVGLDFVRPEVVEE